MSDTPDWHTHEFPELRPGPPWVMQEMIAAEPALVQQLLRTPPDGAQAAAGAIAEALGNNLPVTVCGCGTSEHAAYGVAALLTAAVGSEKSHLVQARPAFSAAQDPRPGVCVVVSHEGGTHASTLALKAARSQGARTVGITQQPKSAFAAAADVALLTPVHDESWCHTVAYTSALAVGATLAAGVGPFAADPAATCELLDRAVSPAAAASIAERLADRRVIICTGAEPDLPTARELALKIAEGANVPTLALELETVLHGQLAAHEPTDALVLVAITESGEQERAVRRTTDVARAAATIGLRIAGLLSDRYAQALGAELMPDGRMVTELPASEVVNAQLAALLAGAGALQSLTLELTHARGTNPDLIRREQAPYRHAAEAAESSDDW